MLYNSTSASTTQSLNIVEILLYAKHEKSNTGDTGYIFHPSNFAKDWESIYIQSSQLTKGTVEKGMRKIVSPSLIITSKKSKMVYVYASDDEPVYLPNVFKVDPDYGYFMAFRLAPVITPEYIYYMCQYDIWSHLLAMNIGQDRGNGFDWSDIGFVVNSAEALVRSIGVIEIPSLSVQLERVQNAKEQENAISKHSQYDTEKLSQIINNYLQLSGASLLFKETAKLGLLREIYVVAAGSSVDDRVVKALSGEIFPFNADAISETDINILAKNLASVFHMLVDPSEFSWDKVPEYMQPKEVTDFMVKLADIPAGITVYNPFAGLASYAVALPGNTVVGEEINPTTWAVAQIRILATGVNARITNDDSFTELASDKKYDAIITSPVYLNETGRRINDIVDRLYDKLTDNGKLVCLVSHNLLFAPAFEKLRERLISDKSLKAVITLPNNIFPGTSITQDALFIQRGNQGDTVIMADASGATRYAKSVYRMTTFEWEQFLKDLEDEIEDYYERGCTIDDSTVGAPINYQDLLGSNLTPSIYLTPKPQKGVALSMLASSIRETRDDGEVEYYIVGSSIPEAMHRMPYVPEKTNNGKVSTAKSQVLISGDAVIVSIVSGEIRTVYMENFYGKIAFPNGFIKVLKPAKGVGAKYLAAVLSTKIVADQIKAQTTHLTIPRLNKLDLSQVIIPDYPTEEEKEKLISEILSSEMSELENELQLTIDKQKREIRSTRHAMIQTLSALSSNWEQLNLYAKYNDGTLRLSDIVGRINPISVEELMGSIGYAISTLERQVESLRFEKSDWGQEVEINPYKFINDYIANHSTPDVRMINVGNNNSADIPDFNEVTGETTYYHTDSVDFFYAPERLLERIFNNIVANAKAHGFSSDRTNNEIRFDWQTDNGNIVITIANNGAPLKDGVTSDDVLMSGFSTALNENAADGTLHSGNGGYEIKSLMETLGSVEVVSDPTAEYPVIYKLTFEKTNFVNLED